MTALARALLLTEIFSAIQGEGALVGERQVFVRLAGCNIRCTYCDQPESLELRSGPCRIEATAGRRDWAIVDGPVSFAEVASAVDRLWSSLPHHSVSITGGEPLVQAVRLARVLPALSSGGRRVMLETNGTLPKALAAVLEWISHVSMDVKLDSVDGQGVDLEVHRRFLELASRKRVFVKIVVGASTDLDQLREAVRMVDEVSPEIEVFLQPVSPFGTVEVAPGPDQVLGMQEAALLEHARVRVVPQTHRLIGQL